MAEEKMTDKVMRLMRQQDKIRNIAICAHIDHGKCISKDSRLLLSNGKYLAANALFDLAKENGLKFEEKNGHIIYDVRNLGINIFSLNKESGKVEKKPISLAWK